MIEVSRLTLLILAELLLGLTLLSGFLLGNLLLRRGRVRQAARHLVDRIQSDKAPRTERLRKLLEEEYKYTGEKLEQGVHDLTQSELRLYQNIINSYLKQDALVFQQTDVEVENLVVGYQALELPKPADAASDADLESEQSGEFERLREENSRLADELRVTMDTMGRMLNEYSSMFAGGVEGEGEDGFLITKEPFEQADPPAGFALDHDLEEIPIDNAQLDMDEPSSFLQESGGETDDSLALESLLADTAPVAADAAESAFEHSMMDDLEELDIEIPEVAKQENTEQPVAGSLEEEWARLLADDAESQPTTDGEGESEIAQKSV